MFAKVYCILLKFLKEYCKEQASQAHVSRKNKKKLITVSLTIIMIMIMIILTVQLSAVTPVDTHHLYHAL